MSKYTEILQKANELMSSTSQEDLVAHHDKYKGADTVLLKDLEKSIGATTEDFCKSSYISTKEIKEDFLSNPKAYSYLVDYEATNEQIIDTIINNYSVEPYKVVAYLKPEYLTRQGLKLAYVTFKNGQNLQKILSRRVTSSSDLEELMNDGNLEQIYKLKINITEKT